MAFQRFYLEDGRIQVKCSDFGPIVTLVPRPDGTYAIQEEDVTGSIYQDYRTALLAARKLAEDPDL
jgi:hypothetical protein